MFAPNYSKASAHYRSLAISSLTETADPHELIAMLYDELLLSIDVLTIRSSKECSLLSDEHAHRARSIVVALRSGLDLESGGELAMTLDGLYSALANELEIMLSEPHPLRFAELRAGVESLRAAWNAIAQN